MSLFDELKRRNVIRVGAAYIVAAWVLAQVVDLVLEYVTAPDWIMHVFMLFVGIGFIAAVVIAWAYELTPDGVRRESEIDRSQSIVTDTGRKLDRIIIGFLAVAVIILLGERFIRAPGTEPVAVSVEPTFEPIDAVVETATRSIAVLPFVNLSTDVENEFFSDGISEEILNVLASIPELKVAARTSAFAFKGTNTNISDIAAELGVNHVLEGSVRKAGNQIRVTAQLIQASDGFHLWSENYDRELTNIFTIQDEIAGSIAEALKVTLELEAGSSGNLTGTNSIEAYEHYLKGMQLWHERTAVSLEQSRLEFESAILLDPAFAKAQAGLALYWTVVDGYILLDSSMTRKEALAAAAKTLKLDPANVEAMTAEAGALRYIRDFQQADRLFKRVKQLNPSFATAYQWHGGLLGEMGDPLAGLASYQKAWSLDPRSRIIGYNLAYRLWALDRVDEAVNVVAQVLEFAPEFPDGLGLMMMLKITKGDCESAEMVAQRLAVALAKTNPDFEVYRAICQDREPASRRQAFETMMAWPEINFADPDHPSLSYLPDVISLMIHTGILDLVWPLIESEGEDAGDTVAWLRTFRTDNGIRLQCSPQMKEFELKFNIPPAVDTVICESTPGTGN